MTETSPIAPSVETHGTQPLQGTATGVWAEPRPKSRVSPQYELVISRRQRGPPALSPRGFVGLL